MSDSTKVRTSLYPALLKLLRETVAEILISDSSLADEKKVAGELCYAHFTVDTEKDGEKGTKFVDESLGTEYAPETVADFDATKIANACKKNMKTRSLWSRIKSTFNSICRSKNANSTSWFEWDPAQYSVRSIITEITVDGQKVTLLRTACPVMGHNNKLEVDPLFKGLMSHYKAQRKTVPLCE